MQPDGPLPTDYVVIRLAPDLPAPARERLVELDGRWYRREKSYGAPWNSDVVQAELDEWVAVATGRVEIREDGVPAEVYEVRL